MSLQGNYLRCHLCTLAFSLNCRSTCSLDSYRADDGTYSFPNWNNWHARLTRSLPDLPGQDPYFSPTAVRMFAAKERRRVTNLRSSFPILPFETTWRFGSHLRVKIEKIEPAAGPDCRLTLGIIAASDAWGDVLALWDDLRGCAQNIVVALDTENIVLAAAREAELAATADGRHCRVIGHKLDRDFAAQRNRVQQAAQTSWVLQLDCDERLTAGTRPIMSGILDDAERHGWAAISMTRRNMVDGIASALYPDVQCRLLRSNVRFTRAVHEYPDLSPQQRAFTHLGAGIIHTLASERFGRREIVYEGIEAGAARPQDTALLRRLLEPTVIVTS